jgi:uncharacterized protein (DUF58 family)
MITTRLAPSAATSAARATGRWAFGPTSRTVWLLAAGLALIVPAWIDTRSLLLMAAWDLLVLALVAVDVRGLPVPEQLTVTRTWNSSLTLGTPSSVTIKVENHGASEIDVRLADYANPTLRRDLAVLDAAVRAGAEAAANYDVRPRERGDVPVGVVALSWQSPWRLAERWATAPIDQTVRVYPDLRQGRDESMYLIRSRQVALEKRRSPFRGTGREFDSLRDHRDGDERRDICWTASARRGKLVTRVYQPERSQAVWILVDAGRLLRARVGERTMLDLSVTAGLTLAQVALGSGDRVGLLAYGRRLQHRVAPARGGGHLRALIEALATVRADGVDADHARAAATILTSQRRRGLIVWFTEVAETAGVPDVVEQAATMAARHVVLFVVVRQPELHDLSRVAPDSPGMMYRVLAAQEALDRRETLLQGLRQRGALVLEVSPDEMSGGVVDRYLEVKERGLL